MKFSPETVAKLKRVGANALIFGAAAGATASLQYLQGIDYGDSTPFVVAFIGICLKTVQAWVSPEPGSF